MMQNTDGVSYRCVSKCLVITRTSHRQQDHNPETEHKLKM